MMDVNHQTTNNENNEAATTTTIKSVENVQQFPDTKSPDESEQLLATIKSIWQTYRDSTAQLESNAIRKHWMQLFLYYCQFVNFEDLQKQQKQSYKQHHDQQESQPKNQDIYENYNSFFKIIPEQVFSYLLECVCDIINQSEQTDFEESSGFYNTFKHHNFAQLATPYDCNKIVALRTFLTHQLGQHLLLFLLRVDIKLIASQKSLCKLCLCLFPNCTWASETSTDLNYNLKESKILDYVGEFRLLQPALNYHKNHYKYAYMICKNNKNLKKNLKKIDFEIVINLEEFCEQKRNSDEIAYLLIRLMYKTITVRLPREFPNGTEGHLAGLKNIFINANANEKQGAPNVNEILQFALQKLNATDIELNLSTGSITPTIDNIAGSETNVIFLKWELLRLLVVCLNVQFAQDAMAAVTKSTNQITPATTTTTSSSSASASASSKKSNVETITNSNNTNNLNANINFNYNGRYDNDILKNTDFALVNNSLYGAWTQINAIIEDDQNDKKDENKELCYAICYILCGMLHNAIVLHTQASYSGNNKRNNNNKNNSQNKYYNNALLNRNLYTRKLFGIVSTDGWLAMFKLLLLQHQDKQPPPKNSNNNGTAANDLQDKKETEKEQEDEGEEKTENNVNYKNKKQVDEMICKIVRLLLNISELFALYDQQIIVNYNFNNSNHNLCVNNKNHNSSSSGSCTLTSGGNNNINNPNNNNDNVNAIKIVTTSSVDKNVSKRFLRKKLQHMQQHEQQPQQHCIKFPITCNLINQHQSQQLWSCYFQGILFDLLPILQDIKLLEFLMHGLMQCPGRGICCCHYTLHNFEQCLILAETNNNSNKNKINLKKYIYKYLQRKLLPAIFMRRVAVTLLEQHVILHYKRLQQQQHHQQQNQQQSQQIECTLCETRAKSLDYHGGILRSYKKHAQLELISNMNQIESNLLFLRHLRHIGKYLPYDIATGIVADIALPLFREEKQKYCIQIATTTTTTTTNIDVRLLQECLHVLASYLQDIRLIKAFYLEENIRHLEDLLVQPLLLRPVLQLIKIGIESSTFLGDIDNLPREQLLLSRRLIMLQVGSSQKAAHNFQQLLRRLWLWHRKIISNQLKQQQQSSLSSSAGAEAALTTIKSHFFWFNGLSSSGGGGGEETNANNDINVTPLQILQTVTLQWALNCELLKTSAQFYSEFAKSYSIVLDEEEDIGVDNLDEEVSNEKLQQQPNINNSNNNNNNNERQKEEEQQQPHTILDILQLNFNALSSFLLKIPKKRLNFSHKLLQKQQQQQQQQNQHVLQQNNYIMNDIEKDIDNFASALENISPVRVAVIVHMEEEHEDSQKHNGNSFLPQLKMNSIKNKINDTACEIEETNCEHEMTEVEIKLFVVQPPNEILIINDVIGASLTEIVAKANAAVVAGTTATTTTTAHIMCNSTGREFNLMLQSEPLVEMREDTATTTPLTDAYQNQSMLSKIVNLFGSFFAGPNDTEDHVENETEQQFKSNEIPLMDDDLSVFYDSNSECKKLLLKLFEITLTICVKAYHNEDADKMQSHLRKLKSIILENAINNWQSHSEENARDNVVLKTLQTLLKIAEMMGELQRNEVVNETINTTTSTITSKTKSTTKLINNNNKSNEEHRKRNSLDLLTSENRTPLSLSSSLYGVTAAIDDDSDGDLSDQFYKNNFNFNYNNNNNNNDNDDDDDDDGDDDNKNNDYNDNNSKKNNVDCDVINNNDVDDIIMQQHGMVSSDNAANPDDGYEADGEIADSSAGNESDVATHTCLESTYDARNMATAAMQHNNSNNSDMWQIMQPASRYRSHILHSGLCRLVVEILMELSHLCVKQAVVGVGGWCEALAQLANRLFVVRECLGGPLFLLRGFAPVLTCNDVRLKELQQCILELITDLNTPDLLCAYFAIMATPNPPMDILVNYMGYICMGSLMRRPCPKVELEFPLIMDGKCISTADALISRNIERIRNHHMQCQIMTPLTRSPCIIPITHAHLWNDKGLTISLWLQPKSSSYGVQKTTTHHDEDARSSGDDMTRIHLVSIGTDQTMLSIYLNSNLTLAFETNRPYAEFKPQYQQQNSTTSTTPSTTNANANNDGKEILSVINNNSSYMKITTTTSPPINSKNNNNTDFNNITNNHYNHNNFYDNNKPKSQFRNALKQTKQVFLNHFSHMHFFNNETTDEAAFENTLFELKALRLMRQKWSHLVFSIIPHAHHLQIQVHLNALEQHEFTLPFANFQQLSNHHNFQVMTLGEGQTPHNVDSRSTLDATTVASSLRYSLSNVMLFRGQIVDIQPLINLTAMGPDFTELPQCQVGNWKANYGYLQLSRMQSANFGNHADAMKLWWERRIAVFSAETPDRMTGYEWTMDMDNEFAYNGRSYGLILYAELIQNQLPSLQTAALLCGGLSTLLFMFARVVETTADANTQANALDMVLKAALSDSQLFTEFVRQDYMSLLGHVIRTELCTKDVNLLRSIVNNACTQPLISRDIVNENTNACIMHPKLLISVLQRYADWHRPGAEHSHVLDCAFKCILALTREKHPQRDFNMEQLQRAGLMQALLNLCKVYVIESPNPVFISQIAAERFVAIVSVFAGSPPSPSLMDEIMKLLLLLHKPSECYITHDRHKFYFLLRTQRTSKTMNSLTNENCYNLSRRVTASFRRTNKNLPMSKADVEHLAREARVERLRKLRNIHLSNYRRPLKEFVDNLELTADCTRLNQQAPRLLSPKFVSKWRQKFKKHQQPNVGQHNRNSLKHIVQENNGSAEQTTSLAGAAATSSSSGNSPLKRKSVVLASPQAIAHKRLRLQPSCHIGAAGRIKREARRTHSERQNLYNNNSKTTASASNTSQILLNDDPSTSPRAGSKTDFHSSAGIVALQEGLLNLLKDFLCLLPDNAVDDVLKHYIKVEYLLVLANHNSCAVRAAIVQLLAALTKRLSMQDLNNYAKHYFPQHLGNQLCMHPTDLSLFEACLQWVTGIFGNMEVILNTECLHVQQRFGLNALLAIITNAQFNQCDFLENAFHILRHLFNNTELEDQQQQLFDAGILQCSIKTLYNLYLKPHGHERTEKSIKALLMAIGEYSLKSVGHITIIWDILNILSWYQEQQDESIVQEMRSVQSEMQLHWIKLFFDNSTTDNSIASQYKLQVLHNSTLSMSETRTRLELLIDRSAQFFTVCNANYEPTTKELELFKWLVNYGINCNQRCSNLLAWGLKPLCPRQLRAFIVHSLWLASQEHTLPAIICDGKMLKSLLWLCQLEDLEQPIEHLEPLCKRLGINDNDSAWNLANELERIEVQRISVLSKLKAGQERTLHKFNTLASSCIESSMIMTRRVADVQNAERKVLMHHMKDYDESCIYSKWLEIIRRMTHEGAPWYCKERSENSWELDNTEGPSRVHTRLRRCHLDIDPRFLMENYRSTKSTPALVNPLTSGKTGINSLKTKATTPSTSNMYSRPLDYLIGSYDQQLNISLNSQILYNFPAKYLPVDGEIDGEIIITGHQLYFLATYHCKYFYVSCEIANIAEIWLKRHEHQEKAFEIFLDTNQSLFFSLHNQDDWKIVREVFCDKIVSPPDTNKILLITQQWREGLLTNWEYLMSLNQISGRTYNDLMQYPVFPWILANYTNEKLDLLDPNNYRKLGKPIAVQYPDNEHHYVNNYTYMNSTMTNMGSLPLKPYHYSSHYSNSGTVLHFMVRVPPFTSYFLRYQDNNFDLPDRTFHALNTTWNLASRDSPTDVKELIPEFFCLPEMFENFERFNFGCRQNGERVEDVLMPAWCLRQPRLFVLIHRQALESEFVRNNLHHWIDLIFGFKQTGDAAIEAINVFHPATYSMFVESDVLDPIERQAVETMVRTYGQMPRQLFKVQHPSTKALNYRPCIKEVLKSVHGLRWGLYVGSPQLPVPTLGNIHKLPGADQLLSFNNTNAIYGLSQKSCVMQGADVDTYNVVSWGYDDRIVRIQPLSKMFSKPKNLLHNSPFDDITACGACPHSNQLWFGHQSGRISVYKCHANESSQRNATKNRPSYVRGLRLSYNSAFRKIISKSSNGNSEADGDITAGSSGNEHTNANGDNLHREGADLQWVGPTVLIRHMDQITCISLSVEFKIAVSAGRDGIAVIWDLNNLSYVRTIERPAEIHLSPITLLTISPTLGDIVTVHTIPWHCKESEENMENVDDDLTSTTTTTTTANAAIATEASFASTAADECFEVTEDDFVNVYINPNGKSLLRLHTINARYVQHLVHEERILAACYSYVKEGVGVNVIATAIEGGVVRLWSSWNLSFVSEIVTGLTNIKNIAYSTHQHLVVLTKESHIQVWETEGLTGSSPKFPQIVYK